MNVTAFALYTNANYVNMQCCPSCRGDGDADTPMSLSKQSAQFKKRLSQSLTSKEKHLSTYLSTHEQKAGHLRSPSLGPHAAQHTSRNDKDDTLTHFAISIAGASMTDVDKMTIKDSIDNANSYHGPVFQQNPTENKGTPLQDSTMELAAVDIIAGADLLRQRSQSWQGETPTKPTSHKKSHSIRLLRLLADKIGFDLFMEHLFSGRLFFPFSALCKFHKKYVLSNLLPQSAIVYNDDLHISTQINVLIERYVKQGSLYELNLPYDVRHNCIENCKWDNIKTKSEQELSSIFDPVVCSLYDLMESDSYQRFVYTESFRQYSLNYVPPR
ncbi:hypothetical protein RFI_04201 [Reticulomyxa filosa]|uniref:RGS domain-containing protein n=1 Tax=Reticulomyxa filosa TaxID=46433 RepID=X6P5P1_RETFI|nr:hypothetical protein RFI_04201 [Reticulomyxa filosa]|eukprot:ETO32917.1 hypothetical protein RFI_04201 [Reticulomyxa filosa]